MRRCGDVAMRYARPRAAAHDSLHQALHHQTPHDVVFAGVHEGFLQTLRRAGRVVSGAVRRGQPATGYALQGTWAAGAGCAPWPGSVAHTPSSPRWTARCAEWWPGCWLAAPRRLTLRASCSALHRRQAPRAGFHPLPAPQKDLKSRKLNPLPRVVLNPASCLRPRIQQWEPRVSNSALQPPQPVATRTPQPAQQQPPEPPPLPSTAPPHYLSSRCQRQTMRPRRCWCPRRLRR